MAAKRGVARPRGAVRGNEKCQCAQHVERCALKLRFDNLDRKDSVLAIEMLVLRFHPYNRFSKSKSSSHHI